MIKSMTGFGRAQASDDEKKFTIEIKSVNHRYIDFNIKMPKKFSFFEASIRNLLKKYVQRGKIDVFITYEDFTPARISLKYNKEIALTYLGYLKEMEELGLENDIRISNLSKYPEVLTMEEQEVDDKALWSLLEVALKEAVEGLVKSRQLEGEALHKDLLGKLDFMEESIKEIEKRAPEILLEYRGKLEQKIKEIIEDTTIEESKVATEVVLFADKICTDEEVVRLRSHIDNMREVLQQGEGIGRKLDFIAQEMNREANTILSKANDITVSNLAIDLKTEIEKIREQIQNIE